MPELASTCFSSTVLPKSFFTTSVVLFAPSAAVTATSIGSPEKSALAGACTERPIHSATLALPVDTAPRMLSSWSLVRICCSTAEKLASCATNSVESIGCSGS
ncbi:MAG: hypothetical protein QM699_08120 [Amaricoccus sp.]